MNDFQDKLNDAYGQPPDTNEDRLETLKRRYKEQLNVLAEFRKPLRCEDVFGLYVPTQLIADMEWFIEEVDRLRGWISKYKEMSEGDYQLKKIDSLTKDLEQCKKDKKGIADRVRNLLKDVAEQKYKIKKLEAERDEAKKGIRVHEQNLMEFGEETKELEDLNAELRSQMEGVEIYGRLKQDERDRLAKENTELKAKLAKAEGNKCPACHGAGYYKSDPVFSQTITKFKCKVCEGKGRMG